MDANRIVAKLEELKRRKRKQSHIRESYRRKLLKRRVFNAVDEFIDGREQEELTEDSEGDGDYPSKS